MTGQKIVGESSAMNSRKELLRTAATVTAKEDEKRSRSGNQHKRIGEVAGVTAAECAMVCCCCPCTVLHFLLLALYKVPTGLCRKAWRNKKQMKVLKKKNNINNSPDVYYTDDVKDYSDGGGDYKDGGSPETVEFETEMWHRFNDGAGFGRSSSQKEEEEQQQ